MSNMTKKVSASNPDDIAIRVRLNYSKIAAVLESGRPVFVADLGRRSASYARKRLKALLNKAVECETATLRSTGEEGYYFELKKVPQTEKKVT